MSREEDAYVIERMGKLLAEIAIIVNGTQPHDTLWSYHDLPEKVSALKEAQQPAAAVPKVTLEMIGAGMKEWDTQHSAGVRSWPTMLEAVFLAMLAAAERAQGVGNDHA